MKRARREAIVHETARSLWGRYRSDLWPEVPGEIIPLRAGPESSDSSKSAAAMVTGDPGRQKAGGFAPVFHTYTDRRRRCIHCGASYTFSAAEQKFWYETLGFYTRSKPTGCPDCRRALRWHRRFNEMIAERLKTIDQKDWRALRELGHLYLQLGSKKKSLESFCRAKNLCGSDEGSRESLRRDIKRVEATPPLILPKEQFSRLGWISSATEPDHLKDSIANAKPFLSDEGRQILAEVVRRWTKARYGSSP